MSASHIIIDCAFPFNHNDGASNDVAAVIVVHGIFGACRLGCIRNNDGLGSKPKHTCIFLI